MPDTPGTSLVALGHAGFLLRCGPAAVLIDCWRQNPRFPSASPVGQALLELKNNSKGNGNFAIEAVLVTHGHRSHVGDAADLSRDSDACVFSVMEVCAYLSHHCGLDRSKSVGMNLGGTVSVDSILGGTWEATLVPACHSASCNDHVPGELTPGGVAGAWVIKTPTGSVVYHAGDTAVSSEMQIVQDLFEPDVAIVPIGGHYCMSAKHAAFAVERLLPRVPWIVPWSSCVAGTNYPIRRGTVQELRTALSARHPASIVDIECGDEWSIPTETRDKIQSPNPTSQERRSTNSTLDRASVSGVQVVSRKNPLASEEAKDDDALVTLKLEDCISTGRNTPTRFQVRLDTSEGIQAFPGEERSVSTIKSESCQFRIRPHVSNASLSVYAPHSRYQTVMVPLRLPHQKSADPLKVHVVLNNASYTVAFETVSSSKL